MPPPSVIIKSEVKKEEPGEVNGKENEEEDDDSDRPFSKMTMRLRRNISNPQCVSWQKEIVKQPRRPVITVHCALNSLDFLMQKSDLFCHIPCVQCLYFKDWALLLFSRRWTRLCVECVAEERMMRSCCSAMAARIITTPTVYYLPWLIFLKETGDAPSASQRWGQRFYCTFIVEDILLDLNVYLLISAHLRSVRNPQRLSALSKPHESILFRVLGKWRMLSKQIISTCPSM